MTNKIIFSFIVAFLTSTSAFADGYFKAGLLYSSDKSGTEGSAGDTTRNVMEFAVGYLNPKGVAYGVLHSTDKTTFGGGSIERTAMGPSIGWVSPKDNGPFVMATYFYSAKYNTGNMTGTGFGLDFGYKFSVRKVSFGAQLSKKQITYDKADGNPMEPKYIEDKLDPSFIMLITF